MVNIRYFNSQCITSGTVPKSNINYFHRPFYFDCLKHFNGIFRSAYRFEMLKSANGEINGSLNVIQNSKKKNSDDWTWKEQLEMVKYTNVPILESLLKLDSELDLLAMECFECIMRYMGDLPTTPEFTEVKCVYTILMVIFRILNYDVNKGLPYYFVLKKIWTKSKLI